MVKFDVLYSIFSRARCTDHELILHETKRNRETRAGERNRERNKERNRERNTGRNRERNTGRGTWRGT